MWPWARWEDSSEERAQRARMVKSQVKLSLKEAHTHEKDNTGKHLDGDPTSPWREMTRTLCHRASSGGSAEQRPAPSAEMQWFDPHLGFDPMMADAATNMHPEAHASVTRETTAMRSPHAVNSESGPRLPQPEKVHQKRRPSTDKNS